MPDEQIKKENSKNDEVSTPEIVEVSDEKKPKISKNTKAKAKKKKKKKKTSPRLVNGRGQAHIKSTYNNTIVTITDQLGNTLAWGSSGKSGFKGPKKSTPYAAGIVVKSIAEAIKEMGVKEVDCFVKGIGSGREAAVRALNANGISVVTIKDITSIPHNGCRPRKPRRI